MGKYNSVGSVNNSFVGSSSFKPIAGHVLRNIYLFQLNQAKVATGANLVPAMPAKITNEFGGNPNEGLAPNVFLVTNITEASDISGFVVESPTDVLEVGGSVPKPQEGQVIQVALLGSGLEIYLPCDNSLQNVNVNSKAIWDTTTNKLKLSEDGNISIVSGVVDGITYQVDGNFAKTIDSKVVKVKL